MLDGSIWNVAGHVRAAYQLWFPPEILREFIEKKKIIYLLLDGFVIALSANVDVVLQVSVCSDTFHFNYIFFPVRILLRKTAAFFRRFRLKI